MGNLIAALVNGTWGATVIALTYALPLEKFYFAIGLAFICAGGIFAWAWRIQKSE